MTLFQSPTTEEKKDNYHYFIGHKRRSEYSYYTDRSPIICFPPIFLVWLTIFGPLTAREESLNGKKDTWVKFITFCLVPYVTLLLAMAFWSICQKNDEVRCTTTTNIYTKLTCLISYSSRIDVVLIWNFVGTGYKRESTNKHEDFPIDIKYLITGDRLKLFWPPQLQCFYVPP